MKPYKSRHVSCACTAEEHAVVHAKAREAGMSVSEYLRSLLPAGLWRRGNSAGPPAGKSG